MPDNSLDSKKARQKFNQWKKTKAGQEVIKLNLVRQLGMCPNCFKDISNGKFHVHHMVPISLDPSLYREPSNLILLCPSCNLKQSNKLDERFT